MHVLLFIFSLLLASANNPFPFSFMSTAVLLLLISASVLTLISLPILRVPQYFIHLSSGLALLLELLWQRLFLFHDLDHGEGLVQSDHSTTSSLVSSDTTRFSSFLFFCYGHCLVYSEWRPYSAKFRPACRSPLNFMDFYFCRYLLLS